MNELNHLRTLRGSLSAVSTPIFVTKYSLEVGSSWKALDEIYKIYMRPFTYFCTARTSNSQKNVVRMFSYALCFHFKQINFENMFAIFMLGVDESISRFRDFSENEKIIEI